MVDNIAYNFELEKLKEIPKYLTKWNIREETYGKNRKIQNIYINLMDTDSQGLFYMIENAVIKNIIIENVNITGRSHVGSITGQARESVYNNIKINSGNVKGYVYVGGISGSIYSSNIEKCKNYANISYTISEVEQGQDAGGFGGILGVNIKGNVKECANCGIVGGFKYLGGIVGIQNGDDIGQYVKNSYNIGIVNNYCESSTYGGVIGGNNCVVTNCYYLKGTAEGGIMGADTEGSAEAKTGTFMKSSEFVNLLGSSNWKLVAGKNKGYPVLSWEEGTAITVENYDIYWNGVISKELVLNEFTNWDTKGEVTLESDHINMNTSKIEGALDYIYTKDTIDLTRYNSIVIRKSNSYLKRLYFVTANVEIVNEEVIQFSFETKNTTKLGNETYACDISTENISGWLEIDAFSTENDGNIYEIYLSTKTVEQLKAEYGQ